MSVTKEIIEKENKRIHTDCNELHLHREGTFFLRQKLFLYFLRNIGVEEYFDYLLLSFPP